MMFQTVHEHSDSERDAILGRFLFQSTSISGVLFLAVLFCTLTTGILGLIIVDPVEGVSMMGIVGMLLSFLFIGALLWYTAVISTKKFYENGFELIECGSTRTIMYDQVKSFVWKRIATDGGYDTQFTIFLNAEDGGGCVSVPFPFWRGIQKCAHVRDSLSARFAMRMLRAIAEQGETAWTNGFFLTSSSVINRSETGIETALPFLEITSVTASKKFLSGKRIMILRDHNRQREMTLFVDSENFYPGLDAFGRLTKIHNIILPKMET